MSSEKNTLNNNVNNNEVKIDDVTGDYGRSQVPANERRSLLSISLVTMGFCICMSGLFTGAAMANGLSLKNAIIATLIGNAIITVYSGLAANIGTKYGVSASMLSRHAFGRNGAKLIGLIIAISLTGWFSFQCGFFGQTIHAMFPGGGFLTGVRFAALWGGLLMMMTAIIGFKGLQILSNIGVPLLVVICIYGMFAAFSKFGGEMAIVDAVAKLTIIDGIVMAIGSAAVAGVVQSDISRFAKNKTHCWLSTIIGYIGGNSFVIISGLVFMKASHAANLPDSMLAIGLGYLGLCVLIVSQWTTNDNNLYSSSLGLLQLIPNVKKKYITAALGIFGSVAGMFGIYSIYVPFLIFLGNVVPPISGVIIADYYFVKKDYKFGEGTKYCSWNISAIISLIIGSVFGMTIKLGITSINAMAVAFVAHLIISRIMKSKSEYGVHIEDASGF